MKTTNTSQTVETSTNYCDTLILDTKSELGTKKTGALEEGAASAFEFASEVRVSSDGEISWRPWPEEYLSLRGEMLDRVKKKDRLFLAAITVFGVVVTLSASERLDSFSIMLFCAAAMAILTLIHWKVLHARNSVNYLASYLLVFEKRYRLSVRWESQLKDFHKRLASDFARKGLLSKMAHYLRGGPSRLDPLAYFMLSFAISCIALDRWGMLGEALAAALAGDWGATLSMIDPLPSTIVLLLLINAALLALSLEGHRCRDEYAIAWDEALDAEITDNRAT